MERKPRPVEAAPARRLYGLGVVCEAPIAALAPLAPCARGDVTWHLGSMPEGYEDLAEGDWCRRRHAAEAAVHSAFHPVRALYRLTYADGSEFVIDSAATQVWSRAPAGATVEDTATYLLGPVMGFVLRLRSVTCLHASAVAIGGRAIAFAGHAGAGKSTLAAAFARRGIAVITDDVAALAPDDAGGFEVEPAYPLIRLWPESVSSLFGSPEALPLITPNWEKRYLGLGWTTYRFEDRRLPLAAVYVLDEPAAGDARIEPLDPARGLMALVERAYSANLLERAMRAREFELFHALVAAVPLFRVAPPRGIERLGEFCASIERRHGHASL